MKYLKEQQPLNEKHFMGEGRSEKTHKTGGVSDEDKEKGKEPDLTD